MCSEREEKCGWAEGELTALLLIAHIATVVPAVTLKIFCNAKARPTGEFSRASCSRITEKREGTEEKGHKDGNDKLSERECQYIHSINQVADQSNYKSILVKLGDDIKSRGY